MTNIVAVSLMIITLMVTTFIYYPGLNGPFVFDDFHNLTSTIITDNTWKQWIAVAFGDNSGHIGRPISRLSFSVNSYFWGLESFSYKIINLCLHLINYLLVFILTRQLLSLIKLENKLAISISLLSATIWLIHPLQVSTVLYAVQRMEILSALFSLLSIIFYLQGRRFIGRDVLNKTPLKSKPVLINWFLSFFICLPLAYLSKENGILSLGLIIFIEWSFFSYKNKTAKNYLLLATSILIISALLLFILSYDSIQSGYLIRDFNLSERLLTQSQVLWFYLYLILVPNENNMALYHDSFMIVRQLDFITLLAISGHLLVIGSGIYWKKTQPIIFIGIAWFYTGHLMESTIIPLEMVFEHRNYLPMFGPVLIFSYYYVLLIHKLKKAMSILLISSLFIAIVLQTSLRVLDWKTDLSLAKALVIKQPDSLRAASDLSTALLKRNQLAKAKQVLQSAIYKHPNKVDILLQYHSLFCKNEPLPKAIAQQTKNKLSTVKVSNHVMNSIALLVQLYQQNKCNNIEPFIVDYINALNNNPNIQLQPELISILYFLKAKIYVKQKNIKLASLFFKKAYQSDHTNRSWRILLDQGEFYLSLHLYDKANQTVNKIKENHIKQGKIQSNNFNRRYNKIIKQLQ